MRRNRSPPNLPRLLPAIASKPQRTEYKRAVRNAREDMHATRVTVNHRAPLGRYGGDVGVGCGLDVGAEARVVVCRAGGFHVPESDALDAGEETAFADQPVAGLGGGAFGHLLYHDAEDVGDVFVERAGLALVLEGGVVACYAVLEGRQS